MIVLKKLISKYIPSQEQIKQQKISNIFGERLFDSKLWTFNRSSVSKGMAIGLFWAWIPMPFQMIPASLCAIFLRANVPISIAGVWISNPLTMGPLYYFGYKLGSIILNRNSIPMENFFATFSIDWLFATLLYIWQPMYLGCLILAISFAMISYTITLLFWKETVINES